MATTSRQKKRIRVSRKPKSCPNPLFEKWLMELKDDAVRKESRLQYVYGKALKSLQKYPLVLESAKECKVLQHFGDGLCKILDKKLDEYVASGGTLGNESDSDSSEEENPPPRKGAKNSAAHKTPTKTREYIPTRRSGAYALMMALYKHAGSDGYLKKKELQDLAQPFADVSFSQTDIVNAQYYNAWSAMATLVNKGLVDKKGNPAKYELTDAGKNLAQRLDQAESELQNPSVSLAFESNVPMRSAKSPVPTIKTTSIGVAKASTARVAKPSSVTVPTKKCQSPAKPSGILQPKDIILLDDDDFDRYPQQSLFSNLNGQTSTTASKSQPSLFPNSNGHSSVTTSRPIVLSMPEEEIFPEDPEPYTHIRDKVTLKPGEYDIVLCVDIAEVSGSSGSGKNQKETAAKSFQNCEVPYDVRKLSIGDYLWICKPKAGSGTSTELALPYVVERKRMDDVVSSIKDGRFKEQKFRLKHSGLTRPIYLIEEFGNRQNLGLPEASVMQAIANTLIIEKFQVQWTQKSDESVGFLVQMTKQLIELYRGKTVISRSCQEKVVHDWQTRLVTFKELYTNSTKSKPLSVTMMFAKQLMQLNGLSGEKAEAIVKHYPTPSLLIDAFKAAGSSASTLLANIEFGKSKRKIGLSISALLAKLYTENQLD
uniref:Crossover junction endonuclease MUS81 n=1 Tax=Ceriodaphnia reticulata TaxID=302197 RepID=A0A4Y7LYK7_9CRUS|nr:EOG090X06E6 [Ceriodaphnia reticulata]SVE72942.1 EOG090X06E6 [Ceriodaphnia reticulata]